MATTQNTYTGNGSTTDYSITFEYLKDADVKVTLDHVATTAFTLPNATTLRFTTAPGNNVAIRIFRDTDVDAARFVYSAGSAIKAAELNENADQALYGLQETTNTDDITDEAVTTAKLRDGAVTTAKLGSISITTAKLADSSVTTAKIADDAVTTAKILDDNVTAAKLATDSVTADAIAAGAVATSELATDAVTTVKIVDDAVTTAKIASGAVTSDSIANGTIQTEDIGDTQITTAKLDNDAVTAAKLADNAVVTDKIVDANVTTDKIADSAVTTAKIADAELVELATMGGNTASALADLTQAEVQILDGATVTTAELNILDGVTATATELNQLDGNTLKTTGTDFTSSSQFPAASEIDARITARIDPLGGFEAIADEDSFPATAPPEGTVISIANANSLAVNSSGVGAGTRAGGSDAVVINGFPSTFNSTSLDDGIGLLVIATSTAHTYTFHRVVAKNEDVRQLSSDINDFKARYRIGSSNPTTDNDAGDLFFNTGTSKMLVYNATSSAWEEVQAVGEFFINTLSSSSGTGGGSATFNGTAFRFTLSNAPTYAQQLLVSINGVVQKPNSGTSQPSEGFAIDGSDIILAAAPATGSNAFFITIGSSVGIGTPSDNTISTAKIIDGAVTTAKIAADAVTGAKIADDAIDSEHYVDGSIDTAHLADDAVTADKLANTSVTAGSYGSSSAIPSLTIDAQGRVTAASTSSIDSTSISNGTSNVSVAANADIVATRGGNEKFRVDATGVVMLDNNKIRIGDNADLEIYHDGSHSYVLDNGTGDLRLASNGVTAITKGDTEMCAAFNVDGAVELFNDNVKKFETNSGGVVIHEDTDKSIRFTGGIGEIGNVTGFQATNTAGSAIVDFGMRGSTLRFATGSSERLRIGSSGELMLGTTTAATNAEVTIRAASPQLSLYATPGNASRITLGDTDDHNIGEISYDNSDNSLNFATNAATRMSISSNGSTTFTTNSTDTSVTDLTQLVLKNSSNAANTMAGIRFEASSNSGSDYFIVHKKHSSGTGADLIVQKGSNERLRFIESGGIAFNGDTAAANALDDYEEGTFTPTYVSGITSPGYQVQEGSYTKIGDLVTFTIEIKANSGTNAGNHLKIGGLPFTSSSSKDQGGGFFSYRDDLVNSGTNVFLHVPQGSTTLNFYNQGGSVWDGNDGNGIINRNIHVQGQYFA